MILCIEAWHTIPNTLQTLRQAANYLDEDGRLIVSDGFSVEKLAVYESEFSEYFDIEAKIDISYGVRNARYLSVER